MFRISEGWPLPMIRVAGGFGLGAVARAVKFQRLVSRLSVSECLAPLEMDDFRCAANALYFTSGRCRLVVLAIETGGRWSDEPPMMDLHPQIRCHPRAHIVCSLRTSTVDLLFAPVWVCFWIRVASCMVCWDCAADAGSVCSVFIGRKGFGRNAGCNLRCVAHYRAFLAGSCGQFPVSVFWTCSRRSACVVRCRWP